MFTDAGLYIVKIPYSLLNKLHFGLYCVKNVEVYCTMKKKQWYKMLDISGDFDISESMAH